MDSLTHLAAGMLTPLAFRRTPKRAAVVGFGIAAGALPDMDIFFGSGVKALLALHRGFTHALFWQPIYVTPPKSTARWFGRTEPVFVLEARGNSSNMLLAYRFIRRSQDAVHTPWVVIE